MVLRIAYYVDTQKDLEVAHMYIETQEEQILDEIRSWRTPIKSHDREDTERLHLMASMAPCTTLLRGTGRQRRHKTREGASQ